MTIPACFGTGARDVESKRGRIKTFTGKLVDPFNMTESDVDIRDIAHALANECRYSGHSRFHYSVAQHSVLVSKNSVYHMRLAGLLHDAAEAYLKDIPSPIKHRWWMWPYRRADDKLMKLIFDRFELEPHPDDPYIKQVDRRVYAAERTQVFNEPSTEATYSVVGFETGLDVWSPARAEHEFLVRFAELTVDKLEFIYPSIKAPNGEWVVGKVPCALVDSKWVIR